MQLKDIVEKLRAGGVEIRPIIDYFAKNGPVDELESCLGDIDIRASILYILSELPLVPSSLVRKIKDLVDAGRLSHPEICWAEDILRENKL